MKLIHRDKYISLYEQDENDLAIAPLTFTLKKLPGEMFISNELLESVLKQDQFQKLKKKK